MREFRYDTSGRWLKGNTHIHSTLSDGGKNFHELARLYSSAGYDFLFRTDHWLASDVSVDTEKYPLLWLDGVELDGIDKRGSLYHIVCLGTLKGIIREMGLEGAVRAAREQDAVIILAHPHWTGNSFEDCVQMQPDGVEIYNHVCHWDNGKSNGLAYWEAALKHNPDVLAFTVDDTHLNHNHPGWNGGWIMVNVEECSENEILAAIKRGNFYSSCGPEFHSIEFDGKTLHLRTSPVMFVRIVGPNFMGRRVNEYNGKLVTETAVDIPPEWNYIYMEIEDEQHRQAWTNTLFINNVKSFIMD